MQITTSSRPNKIVTKAWGREEWLVNNDKYCSKLLSILPGYRCSLHYHPIKDETFIPLTENVVIEYLPEFPNPGVYRQEHPAPWKPFHVPTGMPHRFWSSSRDYSAFVLEVSTPHADSDVVRLEESGPLPEGR